MNINTQPDMKRCILVQESIMYNKNISQHNTKTVNIKKKKETTQHTISQKNTKQHIITQHITTIHESA